jgi:nitrogen regulatory protein PII
MVKKVSAIFREQQMIQVEEVLALEGIRCFTTFRVQGRGEFASMIDNHYLSSFCQVDVYIGDNHASDLVDKLVETLHLTGEDEGIISVMPVQELININTKSVVTDPNYNYLG